MTELADIGRRLDNASQGVSIKTNGVSLTEELRKLVAIAIDQEKRLQVLEGIPGVQPNGFDDLSNSAEQIKRDAKR